MAVITHADVTYKIIGCAMNVHNALGPGLREGMYQRALAGELDRAGLIHEEEYAVEVALGGYPIGLLYLDHLVEGSVIVELKALRHRITNDEIGQVVTYLAATGHGVAILLNFGGKSLEYRRILPPCKLNEWKTRIRRYVWNPPGPNVGTTSSAYPLGNPL